MSGKIVQLPRVPMSDLWSWPESTLDLIRAVGIERGYSPAFVDQQLAKLHQLAREFFGYSGTPWSASFEISDSLEPHRAEVEAILQRAAETAQSKAYERTFNAVFIDIIYLAFPDQDEA